MEFPRVIIAVIAVVVGIAWFLIKRDRRDVVQATMSSDSSFSEQSDLYAQVFYDSIAGLEIKQQSFVLLKHLLRQHIVGMDEFLHALFVALLIQKGHVLVEGVPGLAKTKTIASLARALDLSFGRIQCTPDILPGDITGSEIFDATSQQFVAMKGPLFAQVILADELNRTTPKVQSALLEAMEEQQVTIGNETFPLPQPFFVLATQNPLEQEGTYSLPEAQVDRFIFKVLLSYPDHKDEQKMLSLIEHEEAVKQADISAEHILSWQQEVQKVTISSDLEAYIIQLVNATRQSELFRYGASPRASIALVKASKAVARLAGRDRVEQTDIQAVVLLVLRHRVVPHYEVQAANKHIDTVLVGVLQGVTA